MADPSLSKHGSQVSEKTVNAASVESGISIAHLPASGDFGAKPMRRAWLKMDLLALPFVTAIYLLYTIVSTVAISLRASLLTTGWQDKANVGNARIAGLQEKLHMSDTQVRTAHTLEISPAQVHLPHLLSSALRSRRPTCASPILRLQVCLPCSPSLPDAF